MDAKKKEAAKKIESLNDDEPYMITVTYLDKKSSDFMTSVYSDLPVEQYDISKRVISELIDNQKNDKVRRMINANR